MKLIALSCHPKSDMINLYYSNFIATQNQTSGGNLDSTMDFLFDTMTVTCDFFIAVLMMQEIQSRGQGPQ